MNLHHKDSESLLLAIAIKSNEGFDFVNSQVVENDFYFVENRVLFAGISGLMRRGRKVDGVTLADAIQSDERIYRCDFLAEFGENEHDWPMLLEQLDMSQHSNRQGYVDAVLDHAVSRSLLSASEQISVIASEPGDADQKLDKATGALELISQRIQPDTLPTLAQIAMRSVENFEDMLRSGQGIRGLRTGFRRIDTALSGLMNGELYIIAAKSGMGKSTLAFNIAQNIAATHNVKFFSLEMPAEQLVTRMACRAGNISLDKVLNGTANESEQGDYATALAHIVNLKLSIDDRAGVTIEQLKARARMAKMQEGCDLIVVDYLQYLKCKEESRTMEITRISNGLKEIAKELDIPVLALSQMNRDNEKRGDKRPIMSDLKEASAMEHDACAVLFIYIPAMYGLVPEDEKNHVEIIIPKNRHGRTGTHFVYRDFQYGRFNDWGDYPYPERQAKASVSKLADWKG